MSRHMFHSQMVGRRCQDKSCVNMQSPRLLGAASTDARSNGEYLWKRQACAAEALTDTLMALEPRLAGCGEDADDMHARMKIVPKHQSCGPLVSLLVMSAHRQEREERASAALADARAAWEVELRRARGTWAAGEKARREAWAAAKEREVKELTIKARIQPPSIPQRKPSDLLRCKLALLWCRNASQMPPLFYAWVPGGTVITVNSYRNSNSCSYNS